MLYTAVSLIMYAIIELQQILNMQFTTVIVKDLAREGQTA